MIKNNGCCDLKYTQRLKELGVKQESAWYWVGQTWDIIVCEKEAKKFDEKYSAFTVAELGEMLPLSCEEGVYVTMKDKGRVGDKEKDTWVSWETENGFYDEKGNGVYSDTEANARAKIVIWLKEQGKMKV